MKQKKLIKSLLHLISFGFVAKMLSIVAKIITTRVVGVEGMGYFSLVSPIMLLLYTLGQLGLPTAITKLISKNYENRFKIMITSLFVGSIINIILMTLLYLSAPFIANNLLKSPKTLNTIYMLGLLTPLVFLSGIIKGYLFGVNKIKISSISQVTEELGRIIFLLISFSYISSLNAENASMFAVIGLIVAEVVQILTQIIGNYKCFDKNYSKFIHSMKIKENYIPKEILKTSLPISSNRFITTFTYFLEPIILTFILLYVGYSNDYIVLEYGIITGYVQPFLLLPSFFTMAISTSLLPVISNSYSRGKYDYAKKKLKQALIISLCIGILFTFVFMIIPEFLLKFIYNTTLGVNYIRIIGPFFLLHYIQGPLTAYLQAINKANVAMRGTLIGAVIKNILLLVLPVFIGIWGFIVASLSNIFYVTIQHIYYVYKSFG